MRLWKILGLETSDNPCHPKAILAKYLDMYIEREVSLELNLIL